MVRDQTDYMFEIQTYFMSLTVLSKLDTNHSTIYIHIYIHNLYSFTFMSESNFVYTSLAYHAIETTTIK